MMNQSPSTDLKPVNFLGTTALCYRDSQDHNSNTQVRGDDKLCVTFADRQSSELTTFLQSLGRPHSRNSQVTQLDQSP
jgi:hypothetical protein